MNEFSHSIVRNRSLCKACVACSKICPTKAIRVYNNYVEVNPELCIDCGECIRACKSNAVFAKTSSQSDLKKYKYTVAMPSTVIYGQFGPKIHPSTVLHAFRQIGFSAAYDMSLIKEMISHVYDTYLSEAKEPWPKISVNCPAIVRLIQIRYPDLIPHLIGVETPREIAAKLLRKKLSVELNLEQHEIGIFYITPCSAIVQSIEKPVGLEQSYIDGAFSMNELYPSLLKAVKDSGFINEDEEFSPKGILWAMSGGEIAGMKNINTLAIDDVHEITYVFDRIESGKFSSTDYIEAYICPGGCVGGPLVMEERYLTERNLHRVIERISAKGSIQEDKVRSLFRQHLFDFEEQIKSRAVKPLGKDLKQAIALKKEKSIVLEQLAKKNCAACGAPDCETFAEDVASGRITIDRCVFINRTNNK